VEAIQERLVFMMKQILLLLFCSISNFSYAQKLVFNEVGFTLKAQDKELIERLTRYEVKIYNGLFKNGGNDSLELKLNLYRKTKDFKQLLLEYDMKGLTESGFYSSSKNQSYVLYRDINDLPTVMHELSHALLRNNLKNAPSWFNEGLAVFLQSLQEKNGNIEVFTQQHYLDYVKELNGAGKINIKNFLTHEQSKWRNKEDLRYMYAVSYSIVFYIIKTQPHLIKEMAQLIKNKESIDGIFEKTHGSLKNFQNRYRVYYTSR
jgi:hypothetical protein